MLKQLLCSSLIRIILFAVISAQLAACGGGSDSGAGSTPAASATTANTAVADVTDDIVLTGSVGDGPVTGATVEIWSSQGRLLDTIKSDNTASFSFRMRVRRSHYPLLLKVRGGIDLVTGTVPDFQLVSVMPDRYTRQVNINPFSTLIVLIAQQLPGGINADNISKARGIVADKLGFGLDPTLINDPIKASITDANIASLIKSSESLGEMIRRTRDLVATTGRSINGDAVLIALAADLHDGRLDGSGKAGTNPKISAMARVVSGQVLVETLANTLKVGGIIATSVIDESIVTSRPGISSEYLTQRVRVTDGMLKQAQAALAAARVLDSSAEVIALEAVVSKISVGAMPGNIATVLPADSSRSLDNAVILASTTDETHIVAINAIGADTGRVNQTPTVPVATNQETTELKSGRTWYSRTRSGTSVTIDSATATPVTTTAVTTKPATTVPVTTSPATTEPDTTVPVTASPAITEPAAIVPVTTTPAATAPVTAVPVNSAPVISGSPARAVTAGTAYNFQPTASDAEGDTLTFSITGKPAWAGFNPSTGRLSGTPGKSVTGTYNNIVIAVTDGTATTTLGAFAIRVDPAPIPTGSFNLTWAAPVARADGTPLSLSEIGGYRIRYGTSAGNHPNTVDVTDGTAQSATVKDLPAATYYAVMTSYDSNGLESVESAEVVKVAR